MDQGLQKLNADQRLAVWTQRIADCRSSGTSVKSWCLENGVSEKTYYYWQRRIFRLAQEQQVPEFAELHGAHSHSSAVASLEIAGSAFRYMPVQMNRHCARCFTRSHHHAE